MSDESMGPSAGWYPHPSMVDTLRYWDGRGWTDQVAPATKESAAAPAPAPDRGGLIFTGYLLALLLPIGGIIIGAFLAKDHSKHAAGIGALSVLAGFFWFIQFLSA